MKTLSKKFMSLFLALTTVFGLTVPASAAGKMTNSINAKEDLDASLTYDSELLSPEKEKQLMEISKEFNLSTQDIKDLRNLYHNEHSTTIMPLGKIGAVTKIVKVAKPIIIKACKMFGVKMAEKSLADFTDFLFEWQGNLQDGIENFLITRWNWNETAAHWTAKTIMFIVF
jgi:hypothetical protein